MVAWCVCRGLVGRVQGLFVYLMMQLKGEISTVRTDKKYPVHSACSTYRDSSFEVSIGLRVPAFCDADVDNELFNATRYFTSGI